MMKRAGNVIRISVFLTVITLALVSFGLPYALAEYSPKSWTFMVYLDADNDLDPYSLEDINEMEMVGSTEDVNIVVLLDRLEVNGSWLYYIEEDEYPTEVTSPIVAEWGEVNMGDPATLKEFVEFSTSTYQAKRNVLVLWDHGAAFIGVCWDEHTDDPEVDVDHLTHEEIVEALSDFHLEILAFDACLQAMIEVAYEYFVADTAEKLQIDFLIGSEGYVPLEGYPYDTILAGLVGHPEISTLDFAKLLADEYIAYYEATFPETTLSVVEVDMIGGVVAGLRTLTEALVEDVDEETHDLISEARGDGMLPWGEYGWEAYIDLVTFVESLSVYFEEAAALSEVLDSAVYVANTEPMEAASAGGLGIFFPASYNSFTHNPWWWVGWGEYYEDTKFASQGWLDFLYAYYRDHGGGGGRRR